MTVLHSAANPKIKRTLKLRRSRERRRQGLLLAEGPREVSRAFKAGLTCRWLLVDASKPDSWTSDRSRLWRVDSQLFRTLCYRDAPEGVLGVFDAPQWRLTVRGEQKTGGPAETDHDAGAPRGAADESASASASASGGRSADRAKVWHPPEDALLLVATGLSKPGNVGGIARSAAAAGAAGLICVDAAVDVFNPNAIRASTGAVFSLPIFGLDAAAAQDWLAEHRFRLIAADPNPDRSLPHDDPRVDYGGRCALAIGAEDVGLDARWLDAATQRVRIPMCGQLVDSLNASVTAGILLFEARRRRGAEAG